MVALITGAAGFIGSHLTDRLVSDGHVVVGVDNLSTGRRENFNGCELHESDITDRHELYQIANRCQPDLIVHCAASYSDPNLWHRDIDTNVAGTVNATLAARHHGANLVYFQTALPPVSSYAISKIAGEHYIGLSGLPALIFRLANIYGPRNLSGPIPTFFKRLTAGQPCTVTQTKRDTVFVSDLIELVMRAIARGATGKYDVCSGQHYPIRLYFDAVAEALGLDAEPVEIPKAADDVEQMELTPHAASSDFHWQATTPLVHGIAHAVSWYREHGIEDTYTHLRITEAARA